MPTDSPGLNFSPWWILKTRVMMGGRWKEEDSLYVAGEELVVGMLDWQEVILEIKKTIDYVITSFNCERVLFEILSVLESTCTNSSI